MKFRKVGQAKSRCKPCHCETVHDLYTGGGRLAALWWVCTECHYETSNERYHFDKGFGGPITGAKERTRNESVG